jgi:hypothetical protein
MDQEFWSNPEGAYEMMPGETLLSGAERVCSDCKTGPKLGVYKSPAGYYIGTYCMCGPYSRESDYYPDFLSANKDLPSYFEALAGEDVEAPNSRTTEFNPIGNLKVVEIA